MEEGRTEEKEDGKMEGAKFNTHHKQPFALKEKLKNNYHLH